MTDEKFDMAKLPNYLTYARIAAVPLIMVLILADNAILRWLALILYIAAAVTDYYDGYFARKYGTVSSIGRMLDPIADKLLVAVLLLVFAFDGSFGGWDLIPATIILMREIFVSGLREFMGTEKSSCTSPNSPNTRPPCNWSPSHSSLPNHWFWGCAKSAISCFGSRRS